MFELLFGWVVDSVAVKEPAQNLIVVCTFGLLCSIKHGFSVFTVFKFGVISHCNNFEDATELLFELCFVVKLESYFNHSSRITKSSTGIVLSVFVSS